MDFADLHIHTTASDGTLSPFEVANLACDSGLSVIAITDHDTVKGVAALAPHLPSGLKLVPGIEFSCLYSGNERFLLHILGYGFDYNHPAILEAIDTAKQARLKKHTLRIRYLKETFGIKFDKEEIEYLDTRPNVSKLHIAQLLHRRGMCLGIRDGLDKFMSSPDFPDGSISAAVAIEAIKLSGGAAVYAHSLGGECDTRLSFAETAHRVKLLKQIGISGLECYYSRYNENEIEFLLSVAEREGLYVSGGSDFHGANKSTCLGNLSASGARKQAGALTILDILG